MTEIIERGLLKSSPRGPYESNGFAPPNNAPAIERKKTASAAARSSRTANVERIDIQEIDRLYDALAQVTADNHPRTARLLASGTRRTSQKVIEEAGEVALEAVKHSRNGVIRESADLLYHLVALWRRAGINPNDVWTEMRRRAELLGIAEKLPKSRNRHVKREQAVQAEAAGGTANVK